MQLYLFLFTLLLLLVYSGLLFYYRMCWKSIKPYKADNQETGVKVSVIIPARNEEGNIGRCLEGIIAQTYPQQLIEIIVVDDHSTDGTAAVVQGFSKENIRLISLSGQPGDIINSYKKKAIEAALNKSTGELVICTDADCSFSPYWIQTIVSFYKEYDSKFIAMPVSFTTDGSFLQNFQCLDFMSLQGITGAAVSAQALNMCNGANLAYRKESFDQVGGFSGIDHIASGDDMLLMQKMSAKFPGQVHFLLSQEVIVQTDPMHSLAAFFNQRIRWASKSGEYKDKRITLVLLLVYLLNLCLFILPITTLFANPDVHLNQITISLLVAWLILVGIKTIAELYFLFPVAAFFRQKEILAWFPLAQPFHIVYTVIAGWLGTFGHYQWKGRRVQ